MLIQNNFLRSLCYLLPAGMCIAATGCKKLVDPGIPANKITSAKVYSNDSLATEAVNGIYSEIMKSFGPLNGYMTMLGAVYSDEINQPVIDPRYKAFLTNDLQADDPTIQLTWTNLYKYIYQCNDVIEGLENSQAVKPYLRDQLTGEALFIRSLCYFYLVNLFGDVPLVTGTEYTINAKIGRMPIEEIYEQMVSDLQEAQKRLSAQYFITDEYRFDRVRPNQLATTALLARVYLYKKDWAAAENAATQVIQSSTYKLETDLQQTFLSTSKEAILQFMPAVGLNSSEGSTFLPQNGKSPSFVLQNPLLNAFEQGDKRQEWIKATIINGSTYYPYKYRKGAGVPYSEYNMVLRLAEQYLIRAEARIMQNNFSGSMDDVNTIRTRAGLSAKTVFSSQAEAMSTLEHERRIELFAEWGHRWFDLRRWSALIPLPGVLTRADEVLGGFKVEWKPDAILWPIPAKELLLNNFLTQNNGY
jgi:hypothetical protein